MDQQINNSEHEFLWELLANPADFSPTYAYNLQELINDFPQSGVLRALLVSGGDEEAAKNAVAYFNPRTLYKVINSPDHLAAVTDDQIIYKGKQLSANTDEAVIVEHDAIISESVLQGDEVVDTTTDDSAAPVELTDAAQEVNSDEISDSASLHETDSTPVIDENILAKEYEEHLAKTGEAEKNEPVYTFDKDEYFHQDIDDEVYEEIVSIEDINLEQLTNYNNSAVDEEATREIADPIPDAEEDGAKESNYFVIDPSYVEGSKSQSESTLALPETSTKDVSKYNDEKMPYTFMWWLDKTRKEHAEIYQPYVVNNKPAVVSGEKREIADELQQQYFENIFNVNSVDELDKSTQPQSNTSPPQRKEDKIIERFIQQEPQIQHPSGIKLDNENKAKKSSEDRDELVTETLARIYTEQMLYHKAILTYKKLMLKFPEKSLYFAGHIEQLEKKIN